MICKPPGLCVPLCCFQVAAQQGSYLASMFAGNKITGSAESTVLKPDQRPFEYLHKVGRPQGRRAVSDSWRCFVALSPGLNAP